MEDLILLVNNSTTKLGLSPPQYDILIWRIVNYECIMIGSGFNVTKIICLDLTLLV